VERLVAVREQRREAFAQIELPGVQLAEQGQEICRRVLLALDGTRRRVEQITIRKKRR
jgi:hypothetical protein